MSASASVSDMMRRFKDQPPTSRAEREAERAKGTRPGAMWWSRNDKGTGAEKDISLHEDSHTHVNVTDEDRYEGSGGMEPRIGSTLHRPEPMVRSMSPQSRIAKYETMNPHKKPTDYMSQAAARSFGARDTLEVDAMIESEIRQMEDAAHADVRHSYGLDSSVELPRRSTGGPVATLRDSLRSSFGGLGSLANSIEGLDNAKFSRGGGGIAKSVETLGSAGIRALVMPEFRLDGRKDENNDFDKFLNKYDIAGGSSAGIASTDQPSGHHLGDATDDAALTGVKNDMTKLVNTLTKDRPNLSQSLTFMDGISPSGSMAGATTIPQITDFLGAEFNQFEKSVEQKDHFMDMSKKEQQAHDEKIREEGRAEARAKGLFGITHFRTQQNFAVSSEAILGSDESKTVYDEVKDLDKVLGVDSKTLPVKSGVDIFAEAGSSGKAINGSASKISTKEMAPLQQAIDNEMGAADEILYRMRSLRTGLGKRLRRLDALHAQVMNDKDSALYVPPGPPNSMPVDKSPAPLPIYMQKLASQSNSSAGAAGSAIGIAAAARMPTQSKSAANTGPSTPFGTGADGTIPPPMPESISVKMDHQISDKVAHVAQNIASVLTVTLEGTVNRLADNNTACAVGEMLIPGSVPVSDPVTTAATAAKMEKEAPKADAQAAAASLAQSSASAPKNGEDVKKSVDFGPTGRQLDQPDPPKSLRAQLDDMDSVLGADHGPGAPKGLDQFLPAVVRTQNALKLASTYGQSGHPTNVQGTHAHGQAFDGKPKTHAPSALLSSHWAPPPTLFKVPIAATIPKPPAPPAAASSSSSSSSSEHGARVTIVAPSDEELWLKEIQWRSGSNVTSIRAEASAPVINTTAPAVPEAPAFKTKQVPWAGDTGSHVTAAYTRTYPLEGAALRHYRDEDSHAKAKAASQAFESHVSSLASKAAPSSSGNGNSNDSSVLSSPQDPNLTEREQFLRKMQTIRAGISMTF